MKALILRDENITRVYFNCQSLKAAKEAGLKTSNWMWEKVSEKEAKAEVNRMQLEGELHNVTRL